jgi:hypothetical protein
VTNCFCCQKRFSPNAEHHVICPECCDELHPDWSDTSLMSAVRGIHAVAYGDLTDEALTFLAESGAWSKAVKTLMPYMEFKDGLKLMKKAMQ